MAIYNKNFHNMNIKSDLYDRNFHNIDIISALFRNKKFYKENLILELFI